MDVVLISDDCAAMLCIESKYTEHSHHQEAEFADAYFKHACYYKGNPYIQSFIKMALRYNEQKNGYFAGIKQNVSHLIGITNVMHDADALAWFKANNPFIEPEVMEKIGAHTEFVFSNLLYCRPEKVDDFFGDLNAEEKSYPYLLGELLFEHLQKDLDEPLLLSSFIKTYPELFAEVQSQMQKPLADYLDNRYVLTPQPHFALPEGYDTADHYLIDVVMEGAQKRYQNNYTDEVAARIKRELKAIRVRHWADRFLIMWDLMRELHSNRFCTSPGGNRTAGSVVAYCLGITDIDPSARTSAKQVCSTAPASRTYSSNYPNPELLLPTNTRRRNTANWRLRLCIAIITSWTSSSRLSLTLASTSTSQLSPTTPRNYFGSS
jgi:hypothetical protein